MDLFDVTLEPGGILMTQLLAAAFLGYAALAFGYSLAVKSTYEEPTMRTKHA